MEAAIRNIHGLSEQIKVLILGDMFELGNSAREEHQNIVNLISSLNFKNVFLVGKNFYNTTTEKGILKFETFEELKKSINSNRLKNATILIKGSRGMALERVLDLI